MSEVFINPVFTGPALPAASAAGSGQMADGNQFNQLLNQIMDKSAGAQASESSVSLRSDKQPAGKSMRSEENVEQLKSDSSLASEGETLDANTEGESTVTSDLGQPLEYLALMYQVHSSGLPADQSVEEPLTADVISELLDTEGFSGDGVEIALEGGAVKLPLESSDLTGKNPAIEEMAKVATDNTAVVTQIAEKAAGTGVAEPEQRVEANSSAVNVLQQSFEKPVFGVAVQPLQSLTSRNRPGQVGQPVPVTFEPDKTPKYQLAVAPLLQQQPEAEAVTAKLENMEETPLFSDMVTAAELKLSAEIEAGFTATGNVKGEGTEMALNAGFNLVLAHETQQPVMTGVQGQTEETFPVTKENVFNQIVEKATVMAGNGHSEMELDLKPDHLGKIQLRVSLENHLISARFIAESEQVKAILESNLADLKRQLQENGVNVQQLMVSLGDESKDPSLGQNAFSQHRQNQSEANGKWATVHEETELSENSTRQLTESVIDLIA